MTIHRPGKDNRAALPRFGRRTLLGGVTATLAGNLAIRNAGARLQATPEAGHNPFPLPTPIAVGPEGLVALLQCVPDSMLRREGGSGVHWYYGDIAQQFAALGLDHNERGPNIDDQNWVPAMHALALGSNLFQYALDPDFTGALGFMPFGIDQALTVGDPPSQLALFRGGPDFSALSAAWEASGYEQASVAGRDVWTIGQDGEFDVQNPIQRRALASLNNLVLLGDNILAAAPTVALLEEAIATFESGEGSAALDPVFGLSLYTLPGTTVSAIALSPEAIGAPQAKTAEQQEMLDEQFAESEEAVGSMPPFEGMFVGVESGAIVAAANATPAPETDPEAGSGVAVVRQMMTSAADAEQALAVLEQRWTTMNSLVTDEPYTSLMEIISMSVDGNIAQIDFRQLRSPNLWQTMIFSRDMVPFLPGPN